MKKRHLLILGLALLTTITTTAATKALFLTGGQSNTDGRLYAETLPSYLLTANSNCLASCHGAYDAERLGTFYAYYPTSGTTGQPDRWAYDAVTYYYIGQALGETFYVAKTSYGGTSINPGVNNSGSQLEGTSWADGYGSGYHWSADETFLAATAIAGTSFTKDEVNYTGQSMLLAWIANIDAAIDAIKAAGDTPDIKAIIWHQGESDKNVGSTYYDNLKAMVTYVRNHLVTKTGDSKYATLPFFCGTIPHASSLYNSTVEKAFYSLEEDDDNFHVVDLRDLTMLSDMKHFDAPSAELFGKRLFNRMIDEGVVTGEKLPVEYATVDYSDFGTDEYVGVTKTWDFDEQSGSFYQGSQTIGHMYFHGGGSTQRRFEFVTGQSAQSLTYPDSHVQNSTSYVRSNLASKISESAISDSWNASHEGGNCVGVNVLYPGTFTMKVAIEAADKSVKLYFNGKLVDTETATSETVNAIQEITYTADKAGTYYIWADGAYKLWGARYVPTTDRSAQRMVTTDADGYATFGNITGANLGLPAGLTAWAVGLSATDNQQVEMSQLLGVDKGVGVILKGEASTAYELPFAWAATGFEGENAMTAQQTTGDIGETSGEDFVNYTFAGKQFSKVSGTASIAAGKAYLSISNGAAQSSNNILTFEEPDPSVAYQFIDTYTRFGEDEIVWATTTWLCQDFGFPSKYSDDFSAATGCNNGLYFNDGGSSNRSWKSASQGAGSYAFADGTSVTVEKTARSSGASSLPNVTSAHTASADLACDFAVNAAVPGTFSILRSGNSTGYLYFNGTQVATITTTGDDDTKELSYTSTEAGTFVYVCAGINNVAAMRFVPTEKSSVYNKVTAIGWATMSLPYPAVVPDGTCAYYVSGYEDGQETGTLTLTKIEAGEVIPAKQGFLLNGVKGLYRLEKSTSTPASWTDNLLVATADAALTDYDYTTATDPIYVLAQIDSEKAGFKNFSGTAIGRYKAYLQLGTVPSARTFRLAFDETTAISSTEPDGVKAVEAIYSLDGKQQPQLRRGINIIRMTDGSVRKVQVK